MRAVILNFTGQRENWGCQATSWNLYHFCESALNPLDLTALSIVPFPPSCILDVLTRNRHGARLRKIYSSRNPSRQDLEFMERLVRRRYGAMADRVINADIVFFQGEGTMGPSQFYEDVRVFGLPFLAKKLWNKPVISLNQSFVIRNARDRAPALNIFQSFDIVALREFRSYQECINAGIENALLCPDMAFLDAFTKTEKPDRPITIDKRYFCVSGSAGLGGYDVRKYTEILAEIARQTNLLPVVIYSRGSDRLIATSLEEQLGHEDMERYSTDEIPSYRDLLPVLRDAVFTIGGRYHTSISSLASGTPVVLTAGNSYKSEGLGAMLSLDIPVYDLSERMAIINKCKEINARPDEEAEAVAQAVQRLDPVFSAFKSYLETTAASLLAARALQGPPVTLQPPVTSIRSSIESSRIYDRQAPKPDNTGSPAPRALSRIGRKTSLRKPLSSRIRKLSSQLFRSANLSYYDCETESEQEKPPL